MRRTALPVAVTLVGALVVLLLPDGPDRAWWFRGYVAAIGILSLRALVAWVDAQPRVAPPAPFRVPRRSWRRRKTIAATRPSGRLVQLASFSAGDAHRGLRSALQEIADERLRAHHGIALDDPSASRFLAARTWELLRPDRPPPHDLRAPGLSLDAIDALLADVEHL